MEPITIILIIVLWIMYGVLSAIQDKGAPHTDESQFLKFVVHIIFSPIIFAGKALYGVFKPYGEKH